MMASKPKRRKIQILPKEEPPPFFFDPAREGPLENVSNSDKGILLMPVELRTEIFDNFVKITLFTETPSRNPILPPRYFARTAVLRALSQVCVAYRREFLPSLWETLDLFCNVRASSKNETEALKRKYDGLLISPHLRPYIRTANIVLTLQMATKFVPKFRALLQSLENLHTLHLLHTDVQLSKLLRQDGVVLPNIRTLVIQGHCHRILRCCPNVTTLWCVRGDGAKLVPDLQQYCKKVEELRGFGGDGTIPVGLYPSRQLINPVLDIAEAVPQLRVFEVWDTNYDLFLELVSKFKNFDTLIIKTSSTDVDQNADLQKCTRDFQTRFNKPDATGDDQKAVLQKCIEDFRIRFNNLPPCAEKRRIRMLHALSYRSEGDDGSSQGDKDIHGDGDRCSGKYLEVDLD